MPQQPLTEIEKMIVFLDSQIRLMQQERRRLIAELPDAIPAPRKTRRPLRETFKHLL